MNFKNKKNSCIFTDLKCSNLSVETGKELSNPFAFKSLPTIFTQHIILFGLSCIPAYMRLKKYLII